MDSLIEAIDSTPIIDHHAHNLLTAADIDTYDLLTITTEANGPALKHASSTLAHLRAVKCLAEVLGCEPAWDAVQEGISRKRKEPDDAWSRRCFQGIETALIDDGLDSSNIHAYDWHNRLTRSKCKRIVRIEKVVETIMTEQHQQYHGSSDLNAIQTDITGRFISAIDQAIADPEVAGFKSVICYRVGLAIPKFENSVEERFAFMTEPDSSKKASRLEDDRLSPYFVHLTAQMLERKKSKKPFQFHTGLGDNDIDLGLSNPAHLQTFIEAYPAVSIVLLHAAYPFTAQAGYLATVYENCYLDIGEVFPAISQDGQEKVIREALDLCPSEKLTWSTGETQVPLLSCGGTIQADHRPFADGHWFPETYLLAVMQVREAMRHVLCEYVERGALTASEAIKVVQDVFFNTSNKIYKLGLPLLPVQQMNQMSITSKDFSQDWVENLTYLNKLLRKDPSTQYLRLQWLDYTRYSIEVDTLIPSLTLSSVCFVHVSYLSNAP